jgi:hypothetical protein
VATEPAWPATAFGTGFSGLKTVNQYGQGATMDILAALIPLSHPALEGPHC